MQLDVSHKFPNLNIDITDYNCITADRIFS